MILYVAIIVYILSLIAGLFLMAAVKRISNVKFVFLGSVHILFLLVFVGSKISGAQSSTSLSFLFFICTGIILAGLSWRSSIPMVFKIYFSLFSITVALFIFSPSRLMIFLLSGNYAETLGKTFEVGENYFLEQQNTSSTDLPVYKLIKKHGLFHEAIQRDITFKGKLDSIHVIEFIPSEKAIIRGYSGKSTFVSTDIDSIDKEVQLVKPKHDEIERRL